MLRRRWQSYWDDAVQPRLFLLGQLRAAGTREVLAVGAVQVVIGLLPVGFVVASSVLVGRVPPAAQGGVDSAAWDAMVRAFVVATTVYFAQCVLTAVSAALVQRVRHRVDGSVRSRVIRAATATTGIGPLEDDVTLAALHRATEALHGGFRSAGDAAAGMLALVVRYSRLLGFCVLLGVAVSWWSAAVIAIVTMTFRYGHRGGLRWWTRMWPQVGPLRREAWYFRRLALDPPAARELRLFGLSGWTVERYRRSAMAALAPQWKERRRVNIRWFGWFTALGLVGTVAVCATTFVAGARGDLTLTELMLGLQSAVGAVLLGEFYHEADPATQFGGFAAQALDEVETRNAAAERPLVGQGAPARGLPVSEVRFAGVSFAYPGRDRPALDGLDLTLRAGECTALVGLNGAGKTTLVKLLTRLHEPAAGAVLVDGRDVRELNVQSWRRQVAVVFQDFGRYELTAGENITFGAPDVPVDPARVAAAAARAGAGDVLDSLPAGAGTVLSRHVEGGAELSGGQWQRLAIARAMYAVDHGARLLILDEPTAALDVRAEAAFFEEVIVSMRGLTTLLISHRFSSVRHADRIVVLAEGRLVEDGTHDELVAAGGRYARLFQVQAERFSTLSIAGPATHANAAT